MYLILGLGNPGPDYELTRHNLGFMVIDTLSEKHRVPLNTNGYYCRYGTGEINGFKVVIGKPMTYMNESGIAFKAILKGLDLIPEETIVIHDELDLQLGKIKVKCQGGDAGQRGIRSIIHRARTDKFTRIRVGVGRPEDRGEIIDYLLSPFLEEEWPLVNDIVEKAAQRVEETLFDLNHKKNLSEEEIE